MDRESHLDDRLLVYRQYVGADEAARLFVVLRDETKWLRPGYEQDGKITHLPRLTANYGEKSYDYSGLVFVPEPWTPVLAELKAAAEREGGVVFNAAIVQLYRDGHDAVNWHSDDSPLVGTDPVIVSLSFGATRSFLLRAKDDPERRLQLRLNAGDLVVMRGDLQHRFLHKVPREPCDGPRINITFRRIVL